MSRPADLGAALESAWKSREGRGETLRVFHGPGEGSGDLERIAIDRFGDGYWVTEWESEKGRGGWTPEVARAVTEFLKARGARHAVVMRRPEKGIPQLPERILGEGPERFEAVEGRSRFWIRLEGTRHPGLFLDHAPLRRWLESSARGWKVLNAFAYTGSLSVAAGVGGAAQVTTLDLSKPSVAWARENWQLNGLDEAASRFVSGDVFEWLPRLKREGQAYDCVILDPPSFSRGEKGSFSTAKDLEKLHVLALGCLAPGGVLVTSINSAKIPREKYLRELVSATRAAGREGRILFDIGLPETFPTRLGREEDRYLKGWAIRFG